MSNKILVAWWDDQKEQITTLATKLVETLHPKEKKVIILQALNKILMFDGLYVSIDYSSKQVKVQLLSHVLGEVQIVYYLAHTCRKG